mgnify:CR=1 FL=1
MDNDTKSTYIVIAVLIVILGGLAYFLQGSIDMPQVQVDKIASNTDVTSIKKVPADSQKIIKTTINASSTSTTTMQLPEKITSATITTNKGVIEITFATDTPVTVKNFATLALSNFYNGTRFHRVIRDFMIQGGDPLSKDLAQKNRWGTGGPGYTFQDEVHSGDTFPQGTLAMANSGPSTNGSQFFIVTSIAGTPWLIGKHTVFGHVTKGLDIVLKINDLQTNGSDQPIQEVVIEKIEIK